jgi:two-component system phosphate regulon sensor histidine kinase PhoR
MQKKIVFVLVLMSICVLGITGLQLYWNYQNYKTTVANFKKGANDALSTAVDREIAVRKKQIVATFKQWLNDETIVKITCDTNNMDHETAFTIQDVVPYYKGKKADKLRFGVDSFKEKVGQITPKAKAIFIDHIIGIVTKDVNNSITYYYTQGLGHRLEKEFANSKANLKNLAAIYQQELEKKDINCHFVMKPAYKSMENKFLTQKINSSFRKPYFEELVWARLENPNTYYLREMKWLIISSALLIGITLLCFSYTIKTLLNQYKLVAIKNQFISNMTHEINTPLASIQITTEALQQFDHNTETKNKYLEIIAYQTKKLKALTHEILENAKLETFPIKRDEVIDLDHTLLEIINSFEHEHRITLKYQSPQEKVTIKGNQVHLIRSIENVLENAFKYNSSLNLAIEISLTQTHKMVNIAIRDNGPGIPDEFKTKIFDQFYRIPTGNVHDIKGYGLGLSYVKKVISQHYGNIIVLDNKPSGTIFSINLPN